VCDIVVNKVHVRYLIFWWASCHWRYASGQTDRQTHRQIAILCNSPGDFLRASQAHSSHSYLFTKQMVSCD